MNVVEQTMRRIDGFQQRHLVPSFFFGVIKKYGDDNSGNLATCASVGGCEGCHRKTLESEWHDTQEYSSFRRKPFSQKTRSDELAKHSRMLAAPFARFGAQ